MNNFKIPRQKYSTNMANGSYVTSSENDLYKNDQKKCPHEDIDEDLDTN